MQDPVPEPAGAGGRALFVAVGVTLLLWRFAVEAGPLDVAVPLAALAVVVGLARRERIRSRAALVAALWVFAAYVAGQVPQTVRHLTGLLR